MSVSKMATKILVSHSRGTMHEGVVKLFLGLVVTGGMLAFAFSFSDFWRDAPVGFWFFNTVIILFGAAVVFVSALNILMDREFHFLVSEDRVECKSPAKIFGESYSIPIDNIITIQSKVVGDCGTESFLVTRDQRRFHITTNYGNPVEKIVAALRELRPDLPVNQHFLQPEPTSGNSTT